MQGLIKQLEATGEAVVRVDGPYGGDIPPEWLHYSRLVIFAGGIGVRPQYDLKAWPAMRKTFLQHPAAA